MTISLPLPGWCVTLARSCGPRHHPLVRAFDRYTLGWDAHHCPDVLLKEEFQPAWIWHDDRVVAVQPVWYLCPTQFARPADRINGLSADAYFRDHLKGRLFRHVQGTARVYGQRPAALADLATCDLGVGCVWRVAHAYRGTVKMLACAVLNGDLDTLPDLVAALETAGDPLADKVRELCFIKAREHELGRSRRS
jgi:hypothetical protein